MGLTTFNNTSDIVKKTSDIVVGDFSLVIDCIQYGRNIFENIRKFVQYQLACALNLVIFVALGSFIHKDSPMSPPQILWINCLMDTIAASILSSEIPLDRSKNLDSFEQPGYTSILDQTTPFDVSKNQIFTNMMKINIVSSTIYQ